jgi:hypothetical protein
LIYIGNGFRSRPFVHEFSGAHMFEIMKNLPI